MIIERCGDLMQTLQILLASAQPTPRLHLQDELSSNLVARPLLHGTQARLGCWEESFSTPFHQ